MPVSSTRRVKDASGPSQDSQPDGTTSFERILPGPERMYPDTDSPPKRITREHVEQLRLALAEPPWEREARYAAAGVARDTIHYLIRRGGARLVDRVVASCGADLKRTAIFFGEELKGLRRAGVDVDSVTVDRWCELFRLFGERPVSWEARRELTVRLADQEDAVAEAVADEADGWRARWAATALRERQNSEMTAEQQFRHLMGRAMGELRGRIPGARVAAVLRDTLEVR